MKEDFYSFTNPKISLLNQTERKIFDYVLQNIHSVKDKSIRLLSHECFVSTSTMLRFVRKLGFAGYGDFVNLLRLTEQVEPANGLEKSLSVGDWLELYTGNIAKTLQGAALTEKGAMFWSFFSERAQILLLADESCREAAGYADRVLSSLGFRVSCPTQPYEFKSAVQNATDEDLLIAMTGTDPGHVILDTVERIIADRHPHIISVAPPNETAFCSISDLSFYVLPMQFGHGQGASPTTCIIALIDLLVYLYNERNNIE